MARYCGTSGFAGGGGGGGGASLRGGAGGGREPVLEAGLDFTIAGVAAGVDPPGRGRAAGLGLDAAGF